MRDVFGGEKVAGLRERVGFWVRRGERGVVGEIRGDMRWG